jgi:hydroxymethylpyrimidine/phosphomethylpyrimidine kinase
VLIVAGSDSGGGAGLQADIKTVTALGGFAMTAVTAVTVQNTLGVFGIHEIPEGIVVQQMRAVLDDLGVDAVKTGMLHSAEIIEGVAGTLDEFDVIAPLVVDPVMIAKGGASLLEASAIDALKSELIPRAALVTPNIPEAQALTGLTIQTPDDQAGAGEKLMAMGAKAALIKGGHLPGEQVTDVLVSSGSGREVFTSTRIDTIHTHGTGCTLASAIATNLAQGRPLSQAVARARNYVCEAIRTAPGFGQGHGPLNHVHTLPKDD